MRQVASQVEIREPIIEVVCVEIAVEPRRTAFAVVFQVLRQSALRASPHDRADFLFVALLRMQPASNETEQSSRGGFQIVGARSGDYVTELRLRLGEQHIVVLDP